MKKYILLIFACIYAIHLNAQNAGINFLHGTTWAEAVAKAKAENKLIFIDFYTQIFLNGDERIDSHLIFSKDR